MGQEIANTRFSEEDFRQFQGRLEAETGLLLQRMREGNLSTRGPITGFELEAWLVDQTMQPAPANAAFLAAFASPLACPELAQFNVEFNNLPLPLAGDVLARLRAGLEHTWRSAGATAERLGLHLLAIGILPTVRESVLHLGHISAMNRFAALNEQILKARRRPLRLDIAGQEHLVSEHADVMLEAAATSFQIHLQVPQERVRAYYNASILASAPLLAVAANSPFLFGRNLWAETRIPLFEQAVEVGGYLNTARGPLRRVSFGTGYARQAIGEVFEENLRHFPVLLPLLAGTGAECYSHLRLHNGTIWRWNRPLVGFDADATPHVRIEQRVLPAGPSIADMIANAALFYGLAESFVAEGRECRLEFSIAKDNFYQAARHGLDAQIVGWDGGKRRMRSWLLHELLPLARAGLERLGLAAADIGTCLGIIERRAASGRTGSAWQCGFMARHPGDFAALTREYFNLQQSGEPVHLWPL